MNGQVTRRVVSGVALALVLMGFAVAGPGAPGGPPEADAAAGRPPVTQRWWRAGSGESSVVWSRRLLQFTFVDGTTYGLGCTDAASASGGP